MRKEISVPLTDHAPSTTSPSAPASASQHDIQTLDRVVIRFAGDSGDGMQLTGDRFTAESAVHGNDISTLPNFPAEIRAPQGTIPGVSSFQVHFANYDIVTPGDQPDVLVAMNPAALAANLKDVRRGGLILLDSAEFTKRNLTKAQFADDPRTDGTLESYQVVQLDLTALAVGAVEKFDLGRKNSERSKNMFALGLLSWLYGRPLEPSERFLNSKFASKPVIRDANIAALHAGLAYGETCELFTVRYQVAPAPVPAGRYRQITGNQATALGLITGANRAGLQLFLGSYPITPASDILHELSKHKADNVITFQAEDEIGGVGAALGASFAGDLGVTTTSGPGMTLKAETIGLAVMTELPLVVIDVQRAGPSTGMPTKPEQADLLEVMFGRNGESPVAVIAAKSPSDCFATAMEACRLAITYRTPVVMLSDGYLGNGAEPWRIPQLADIPRMDPGFATEPNAKGADGTDRFLPYKRDPKTLARPWALPGTKGLEHRIGGLEKAAGLGNISYDPANHEEMVRTRAAKIAGIVQDIDDLTVDDPSGDADVLVLGWGSTFGPITAAVRRVRTSGERIAQAHLRHINPLPANLGAVLRRYRRVVLPEMNTGQLAMLLRARFLVDIQSVTQVRGTPISPVQLCEVLRDHCAQAAAEGAESPGSADPTPVTASREAR
ncbi:2-oxoacid:acceptor oxidoreductase subunit alpha [Acidipropionibacterium jensenii]|uniref:2-oxoacid:acceptor oxidoreductase subunit alpha n=1 Tax=Acidipropionibacterium jensenii TaxID=1749 RepID=UPI00214AD6BC|nr:2-oxoacid:acceptor oxidoreductase subunit alpha [Acidipropionibacterium jensenii]